MSEAFPVEAALRLFTELALFGTAGWFVFVRLGTARLIQRLGWIPATAFWVLMIAWLGVQLVDRLHQHYPQEASYYPLSRFAMYEAARPSETVPSFYLEMTFADGRTRHVDLADWLPSVEPTALDNRFVVMIRWLRSGAEDDVTRAHKEIGAYVLGLQSILAAAGQPAPIAVALHATSHRVRDGSLAADTVVWRSIQGERRE